MFQKGIQRFGFVVYVTFYIVSIPTVAQDSWASYVHTLNDPALAGKKFRFSMMGRAETIDTDSHAHLWLRGDTQSGKALSFDDKTHPINSATWKSFAIEGTLPADCKSISFGIICEYNGKYYADDVVLEIQTGKKWKAVYKEDFESSISGWIQGMNSAQAGINKYFKASPSPTSGKVGNQSLLVEACDVPNFGTNSKVGKFADVNGIKLYYEVYGTGKPLVVMHGNGGSSKGFTPHYPKMIEKYKVIMVDSRAQGRSTDTADPLTYEMLASDINELLNQLKVDSAYMVGYSDGAILGLIMAMKYPDKVKRVISFGANLQPDSTALFSWAIAGQEKAIMVSKDPKERKLNQLMLDNPHIPFSDLAVIKAPVLVMAGDRDIIRPEHTLKIFQAIPNSQMFIFSGATHGAPWEQQSLFLQLMFDFFEKPFTMPTTEDWFR